MRLHDLLGRLTRGFCSCTFSYKGTGVNHVTRENNFAAIKKGLLEFAVLKVVGTGELYAADILSRLEKTEFATQEGTLYPLLSKLRREGWVHYEWQESSLGPPRKYYRLTSQGRSHLDTLDRYWKTIDRTLIELGG